MRDYQPYVYELTLTKGEEVYKYIGSRSSRSKRVNPQEFLDKEYNTSSNVVHKMLEEGGYEEKRVILETFEGTREGAIECCLKEGEILKEVRATQSKEYLNKNNTGTSPQAHSNHFKDVISNLHKGRKHSEEHVKERSESLKAFYSSPKGEEAKRRMSEARKGVKRGPMSEEQKRAFSESRKGVKRGNYKPWSDETKKRISESRKGDKHCRYKALRVRGTSRSGEVKEIVFDGKTPTDTSNVEIGATIMDSLKSGKSRVVTNKHKRALKHFDVGTTLELVPNT